MAIEIQITSTRFIGDEFETIAMNQWRSLASNAGRKTSKPTHQQINKPTEKPKTIVHEDDVKPKLEEPKMKLRLLGITPS